VRLSRRNGGVIRQVKGIDQIGEALQSGVQGEDKGPQKATTMGMKLAHNPMITLPWALPSVTELSSSTLRPLSASIDAKLNPGHRPTTRPLHFSHGYQR
jgi:hypothetical protein